MWLKLVPLILMGLIMDNTLHAQPIWKVISGSIAVTTTSTLESFTIRTEDISGRIDSTGSFQVDVDASSLKTGIALRDKHLREDYIETQTYPLISFTGNLPTQPADWSEEDSVAIPGIFSMHGKEQPMEIMAWISKKNDEFNVSSSWEVLLTDFSIDIPAFLFVKVRDRQDINLTLTWKAVTKSTE